jgi:hypothetical protein
MKRKSVLMCRTALGSMSGRERPEREIDALDIVYTKLLLGHKATRTQGAGARRADARRALERQEAAERVKHVGLNSWTRP